MNDLTDITLIWDKSGSMNPVRADAIGGFNTFLKNQRHQIKDAALTLVLFDHTYQIVFSGKPIREVEELTETLYQPTGMTALLDAVGRTIDDVGKRLDSLAESEKPQRVLFVIYTDGLENASKDYSIARVNAMISHQRESYSWEFLFLAANQDAMTAGSAMGISHNVSTHSTGAGNIAVGQTIADTATHYAKTGSMPSGQQIKSIYRSALSEEEKKRLKKEKKKQHQSGN